MKRYLQILNAIRAKAVKTTAAALAVAFVCVLALPVVSLAAKGTVEFDEGQGKALVSLALGGDDGVKKGATALELGLKLTSEQMAELTVSFAFEENISKGRIAEFRYHPDTGILNLYVAGETPLFAEGADALTLGNVIVEGGKASINVVENSLKFSGNGSLVEDITLVPLAEDVLITDGTEEKPETVDRSRLQEILRRAAEYKEEDYTPESYTILAEAVKAAEAVLNREDATQAEIDEAVILVENAIGSLVEKKTVIGGNPPSPDGSQNKGETPPKKEPIKNNNVPSKGADTGDKTMVAPYVIAAITSVAVIGGIIFVQRRKFARKQKNEK
ncbi:MAG: hypothetical protein HFI63_08560 [Lachnospiraceae bacterium]|nr:hypothetical protein [Lachnospiraceae bacterium]